MQAAVCHVGYFTFLLISTFPADERKSNFIFIFYFMLLPKNDFQPKKNTDVGDVRKSYLPRLFGSMTRSPLIAEFYKNHMKLYYIEELTCMMSSEVNIDVNCMFNVERTKSVEIFAWQHSFRCDSLSQILTDKCINELQIVCRIVTFNTWNTISLFPFV